MIHLYSYKKELIWSPKKRTTRQVFKDDIVFSRVN